MRRTRLMDDATPRLKDHKVPVVELICYFCDRHCAHECRLLVKAFGASVSFAEIRRRMAMGCERMQALEGGKCGAHFPCLGNGLAMETAG
ncbi:hypothetical protein [Rhizobium leguminosarum]|uniref:hypothetical protein n=1 Tax=Rhizobium leguminosarum TaxID=384 RepID=UPI0021BC0BE9|nr:hypothetical protein [Rhizobium leguminosarum]